MKIHLLLQLFVQLDILVVQEGERVVDEVEVGGVVAVLLLRLFGTPRIVFRVHATQMQLLRLHDTKRLVDEGIKSTGSSEIHPTSNWAQAPQSVDIIVYQDELLVKSKVVGDEVDGVEQSCWASYDFQVRELSTVRTGVFIILQEQLDFGTKLVRLQQLAVGVLAERVEALERRDADDVVVSGGLSRRPRLCTDKWM